MRSLQPLVIFGAGGLGREVHQLIEDVGRERAQWNVLGFLDGDRSRHGTTVHGKPVLGDADWLNHRPEVAVVIAIGSPAAKRLVANRIEHLGHQSFATIVHPRASIGSRVSLGAGTVVLAGASITTDVEIGSHVTLNPNCTVGHDSNIGSFTTLAPGANVSGTVTLGEGCDIGTGSAIIQETAIGHWTVIGAGAVVVRDVDPNVTAVGVPAKTIEERPEGWHAA